MAYVKILAPLTGGACDATVLAGAFAAAAPFKAHVVALFVRPDPAEAMPFFGEGVSGAMAQEIVDTAKEAADKASAEAHAAIATAAKDFGAVVTTKPEKRDTVSVSFREMQGNFVDRVTVASRLSDLVVFGPLKQSDRPGMAEAFEATLLETGRPVVLTGQAAPKNFARRIAIGWDGSGACARALLAAMPYLARAEAIEFLSIRKPNTECESCDEARDYLALHSLSCEERMIDAGSRSIGEVLLEAASQAGADLLVLGGYGHKSLLQIFSGGVTKHVVTHAALPLFLVH
ncbi:MAG TPA: universal stress protein [Rhizomicrobium sp.]|jgi:nucleotide-binding universal stress UspA family protein